MKDKLPNEEVVSFFDKNGFYNTSTNPVYGLLEFYNLPEDRTNIKRNTASLLLSSFSNLSFKFKTSEIINDRFIGDKNFTFHFS